MNKIKILFFLVLCLAGASAAASAQTGANKILVAGKNPLKQSEVAKLVEFYEWAFEANFTAEQKRRFQEYTAAEFRSDPAASRSTINDVVNTLPKILAADADVQRETRKSFLALFLVEARKNSDENSQLLLGIYEAAHNGNSIESNVAVTRNSNVESNNANDSDDSSDAGVGDVSSLAGKWIWGRSGSSTYASGGAYMGSNGSRHTYQFSSDGMVEYVGIMNVMTGGCKMQIFRTMRGKWGLSGDTLTVNWSPAAFTRDDSCSPSKNYKKTLPAETETFTVRFKNDFGQKQLCLTSKDETCFSPANN